MIRDEKIIDKENIATVIRRAFYGDPNSDQREAEIVTLMRNDNALTVSLVAEQESQIIGHISFSKVTINSVFNGWYGLAPVSVLPEYQGKGIGSNLVTTGLERLRKIDASGCVLLGSPKYYQRFDFRAYSQLILEGVPAEYFQALSFSSCIPSGKVKYHNAFEA